MLINYCVASEIIVPLVTEKHSQALLHFLLDVNNDAGQFT